MDHDAHLKLMQVYCANVAITASTLRNLGAGGLVKTARDFLGGLDLQPLRILDPAKYPRWLDDQTDALADKFRHHVTEKLCGPARKCVNIFMMMAALNRILCLAYELEKFEDAMEVPLDSIVTGKLRDWALKRNRAPGGGSRHGASRDWTSRPASCTRRSLRRWGRNGECRAAGSTWPSGSLWKMRMRAGQFTATDARSRRSRGIGSRRIRSTWGRGIGTAGPRSQSQFVSRRRTSPLAMAFISAANRCQRNRIDLFCPFHLPIQMSDPRPS